jgi:hypothetical protein
MLRFTLPLAALFVVTASPAFAQQSDNQAWDGGYGVVAERRSDLVLGVSGGLLLGSTSGYPNEIDKVDEPKYESKTGFAAGTGFQFWLGGALTDWFTFGAGATFLGGSGPDGKMSGVAAMVKVEAFPLYGMGGELRDLAFFADFGAGGMGVEGKPVDKADGGFTSVVGLGSAYELFRVGHFSFAPTAEYLFIRSVTVTSHSTIFGVRALFYGGPSGRQKKTASLELR